MELARCSAGCGYGKQIGTMSFQSLRGWKT
jgi:hypothetical protein